MAAKAIVAERQSIALGKVREHAAALSTSLGVDASALQETVKGDASYQEMVRTEQLAELLGKVRALVGDGSEELSGEAKLVAERHAAQAEPPTSGETTTAVDTSDDHPHKLKGGRKGKRHE